MDKGLIHYLIKKNQLQLVNEIIYLYENYDSVKYYFDDKIDNISDISYIEKEIEELFMKYNYDNGLIYSKFKLKFLNKQIKSDQIICLYLVTFIERYFDLYFVIDEVEIFKLQIESLINILSKKYCAESLILNDKINELIKKLKTIDIEILQYFIETMPEYSHALY
ncbi:hypothetical protein [Clostridium sp. DL1XJH146]